MVTNSSSISIFELFLVVFLFFSFWFSAQTSFRELRANGGKAAFVHEGQSTGSFRFRENAFCIPIDSTFIHSFGIDIHTVGSTYVIRLKKIGMEAKNANKVVTTDTATASWIQIYIDICITTHKLPRSNEIMECHAIKAHHPRSP